jgi:hypothetical protein
LGLLARFLLRFLAPASAAAVAAASAAEDLFFGDFHHGAIAAGGSLFLVRFLDASASFSTLVKLVHIFSVISYWLFVIDCLSSVIPK